MELGPILTLRSPLSRNEFSLSISLTDIQKVISDPVGYEDEDNE